MNNDDEEHVPVSLDEEVSEEDELLYSTYTGPRIFVLNNALNTNVLGILLDESDDSFLVGLPAKMVEGENGYVVQPFAPVPFFRLLKSATMTVMYTFGVIDSMYKEYLESEGEKLYPTIHEYIQEDEAVAEMVTSEAIAPDNTEISLTADAQEGNTVQGMTDEELREYLENKYNNGELAGGSRKKQ